jgi:hypothetical protein
VSTSGELDGPTGPTGPLPTNLQKTTESITEVVEEESSVEYRTVWKIRKFDLENLREDLDRLDTKGRWLIPVGTSLASVCATTFVTWAIEVWGHQSTSFDLDLGLLVAVIVSGLLAVTFFCLEKWIGKRATVDLAQIKKRLSRLISMFPKSEESISEEPGDI